MRLVAPWGLVSSVLAPTALVGGFTAAAARQGTAFDSWVLTISALAAPHAADPWIMTFALYAVGMCHITTAFALRSASLLGRIVLAGGGIATLGVGAFPTGHTSTPLNHTLAAAVAFGAMAIWPAFARRRREANIPIFRTHVSLIATSALLGLVVWFAIELSLGSARVGLAERAAAVGQALWPLVVVLSLTRRSTTRLYATGP